jgi:hypothetical protein
MSGMDELEKHVWEAKVRRMNWEEAGTLSVISKDVLDEILRNIRHREKADEEEETTLSPERAFFQSFERSNGQPEMKTSDFTAADSCAAAGLGSAGRSARGRKLGPP